MLAVEKLRNTYLAALRKNSEKPNIALLRGPVGIYQKVFEKGDTRAFLDVLEQKLSTATPLLDVKVTHSDLHKLNAFYSKAGLVWVQKATQYSIDVTFSNPECDPPLVKRMKVPAILPGGAIITGATFSIESLLSDPDLSFSSTAGGVPVCFLRTSKQKFTLLRKQIVTMKTEFKAKDEDLTLSKNLFQLLTSYEINYTHAKKTSNIYRPIFSIAGFVIATKGFVDGLASILDIDPRRIKLKPIEDDVASGWVKYSLTLPVSGCIEPIPPKWAYHIQEEGKEYNPAAITDCLWMLGYTQGDRIDRNMLNDVNVARGIISSVFKPGDSNSSHRLLLKLEQMKLFINEEFVNELTEIYPDSLLRDIQVGENTDPMNNLWIALLTTPLWQAAPVVGNAEHLKRMTSYENLANGVLIATNRALISSLSTLNPSAAKNKSTIKMAFGAGSLFSHSPFLTYTAASADHVLWDVLGISLQTPEGGPSLKASSNVKMPSLLEIDPTVFLTRSPPLGEASAHRWIANPYMELNENGKVTYTENDAKIIADIAEGIGFDLSRYPKEIRPSIENAGK